MTEQKKVTVFSTPTCMYCNMLKAFLDEKGVEYENVDVSVDDTCCVFIHVFRSSIFFNLRENCRPG